MAQQAERRRELAGSARLVMVRGAMLLRPEQAVFEAMLAGWRSQQRSRLLAELTVTWRERIVRRFTAFTGELPWRWAPGDVEEWTSELLSGDGHAHSTIRSYQRALASFLDYLTDARYGWAAECEARFGTHPVQVCHEWNTAVHAADYEGRPERRPFTRAELQAFFDFADERVAAVRACGSQGLAGRVPGRHAVQGDLCVGAAPPGGGDAGCGRLQHQPGGPGAGPVRHPGGALWQGDEVRARRGGGRWPP